MKLLLVEDDEKLRKAVRFQLMEQGMKVEECSEGDEAWYLLQQEVYDLVILDRMLPEMDGLTLLHKMRENKIMVPVIMVTALSQLDDRIDGLEAGADDYLAKPFEIRELIARIHALQRRPVQFQTVNELSYGAVTLNLDSKLLSAGGKSCEMTVREAELLELLLRNPNQIITRAQLLNRVWGMDAYITESNLDNYIYFIRRRLHSIHAPIQIVTIRGIGYRLEEKKDE